jgi:lysophospholipase L1-like esterase
VPEAGLSTTPVAVDRPLGWIILGTWVVPALTVTASKASIMLLHPADAPLTILLTTGLYLGWIALTLLPTWRGLLIDIGRLLLAKVSFVVWVTLACILVVVGSSQPLDSPWWALAAWVICYMLATAYVEVRGSRKRFVFTMAVLGFTGLLLVAVDTWLASHVLPVMVHNVFVEHEPVLGWRLRPNTTIIRRREGVVLKETINDQGFRTRGGLGARQPGVKRLLFLGDSHTEAYDVDDANTYTALIEQRMSQTRPVEVVSLGVAGYSTDQELLAYLRYGRPYQPDVVILQFCSNDPPFNVLGGYWRGHKPRFERYGDMLLLTGVPVPNNRNTELFGRSLLQRSALMLSLEHVLRQVVIRQKIRRTPDAEEGWRVTALLLRDLDTIVRSDGARLVVFHADRNPESESRLRAILKALDVPYLDTASAYSDDAASYWRGPHWNEKGQRAIAEVLSPALLSYL